MNILAEAAGEVTSGGSKRQYLGAGQEMSERFFLDGINGEAAGETVGFSEEFVADTVPAKA